MSTHDEPGEFDVTESLLAYGWGGMIIRDGVASPMTDEMALEIALPYWVAGVPDTNVVVEACFCALRYETVSLQVVALETLARVAARPGPLPRIAEVQRVIRRALNTNDPRVQSAARATLTAVARHTG